METSQSICIANQLTGFYMRATLAFNGLNTLPIDVWFIRNECYEFFCMMPASNFSIMPFVIVSLWLEFHVDIILGFWLAASLLYKKLDQKSGNRRNPWILTYIWKLGWATILKFSTGLPIEFLRKSK